MSSRRSTPTASALCNLLLFAPPVLGHMEMSWPYPLHSKFDPKNTYHNIDYSMTEPLNADGSNFPCKGYQNDRPIRTTVIYAAGSTYNMTLAGSATHHGGSCQISLSYDNGATFRVIKSMIGGCPLVSSYDFTIPSYVPSGIAMLGWTWQNNEGNREFYMNCAEVEIISGISRRRRRDAFNNFESLPYIWKANLDGVNTCATTEGEDPVYPSPGPDVLYGNGKSSSDSPTEGSCDSPTPYGQTYKDLGDTASSPDTAGNGTSSVPPTSVAHGYQQSPHTAESTSSTVAQSTASPSHTSSRAAYHNFAAAQPSATTAHPMVKPADFPPKLVASADLLSTRTLTLDCTSTVTVFVPPSATTTSRPATYTTSVPPSACTGTVAQCPCASGYGCELVGTCVWQCVAQPPPSNIPTTRSSRIITSTTRPNPPPSSVRPNPPPSSSAKPPTPSPSSGGGGSNSHPPFATGDLTRYLPCVPGTFICTSSTTWKTCNYNDGSVTSSQTWVYVSERPVAAGMECLPFLSPYNSQTQQYAQQGSVAGGSYRDDRIVRARPDGDCSVDGSLQCTDGGTQFEVCDQGGWVRMGAVAAGTTCTDGKIVAA